MLVVWNKDRSGRLILLRRIFIALQLKDGRKLKTICRKAPGEIQGSWTQIFLSHSIWILQLTQCQARVVCQ